MVPTFIAENTQGESRLPIRGQQCPNVRIERLGEEADDITGSELIDLSLDGVTLQISSKIDVYESIQIEIRVADPPLKLDAKAVVRSARRDENAKWILDCDFCPAISQDFLHELAVRQFIDRQRSPRRPVAEDATVIWASSTRCTSVQLRDISLGGFCIICDDTAPIDHGMSLQLATCRRPDLRIDANVRWQLKTDWFHLVGCALKSAEDYPILLEATSTELSKPARRSPRKRISVAVVTASCLLAAGIAAVSLHRLGSVEPSLVSNEVPPVAALTPVPNDRKEVPSAPTTSITTKNEPSKSSRGLIGDDMGDSPAADPKTNQWEAGMKEDHRATAKSMATSSLVSESVPAINSQKAVDAFIRGSDAYRSTRYLESTEAFKDAVESDPQNPLYYYLLAIAQYQTDQRELAAKTIDAAAAMERHRPIENWGTKLTRYQGRARLWLDRQRKAALAEVPPSAPDS